MTKDAFYSRKDTQLFPDVTLIPIQYVVGGPDADSPEALTIIQNNQVFLDRFIKAQRDNWQLSPANSTNATMRTTDLDAYYTNVGGHERVLLIPHPTYPGSTIQTQQPITPPTPQSLYMMVLYSLNGDEQHIAAIDMGALAEAQPYWTGVSTGSSWYTDYQNQHILRVSQFDFGGGGVFLSQLNFNPKASIGNKNYYSLWTTSLKNGLVTQSRYIVNNYYYAPPLLAGTKSTLYTPFDVYSLSQGKLTRSGAGGDPSIYPYAISPDGDYYYGLTYAMFSERWTSGLLTVGLGSTWYGYSTSESGGEFPNFIPDAVTAQIQTASTNAALNAAAAAAAQGGQLSGDITGTSFYGQCNPNGQNPTAQLAQGYGILVDDDSGGGTEFTGNPTWGVNLPLYKFDSSLAVDFVQVNAVCDYDGRNTYNSSIPLSQSNLLITFNFTLGSYQYEGQFTFTETDNGYTMVDDLAYSAPTNAPLLQILPWPPANNTGFYFNYVDSLTTHNSTNYTVNTASGVGTQTPDPLTSVPASTTSTITTPYGQFTGNTPQSSFMPWLHVSNKSHYIQGFTIDTVPHMYLDGQEYLSKLASGLGCQTTDIRAVYFDILLSTIQGVQGVTT